MNNTVNANAISPISQSAAQTLRHEIIAQVVPILELANGIDDSQVRLRLQAHCLDVVTGLEKVIDRYELGNLID